MKTSAFLTELLLPELTRYSGIAFAYPDRMTRAEAQRIRDWAARTPEVRRLVTDKGPNHKEAMIFHDLVNHYAFEHEQDSGGAPANWPARSEPRSQATPENPFGNLFPDELRALQEWTQVSPEFNERYSDEKHPQHAHAVQQRLKLAEMISAADRAGAGETKAEAQSAEPPGADPAGEAAFAKRLGELRADPAYHDAKHPGHKAAVEAVAKLYEARASGGTVPSGAAAIVAAPGLPNGRPGVDAARDGSATLTPQQQIAAKRADKEFIAAYHTASHAGHAAAVREMSALYDAAYPSSPAAASSPPTPAAGGAITPPAR